MGADGLVDVGAFETAEDGGDFGGFRGGGFADPRDEFGDEGGVAWGFILDGEPGDEFVVVGAWEDGGTGFEDDPCEVGDEGDAGEDPPFEGGPWVFWGGGAGRFGGGGAGWGGGGRDGWRDGSRGGFGGGGGSCGRGGCRARDGCWGAGGVGGVALAWGGAAADDAD